MGSYINHSDARPRAGQSSQGSEMDLLSKVSAVKSELEGLVKKTDSALKDLEANKAFPIHDEKEIKKVWAKALLDFCSAHVKVAEEVLGLKSEATKKDEAKPDPTPVTKPEVVAKPKVADEPAKPAMTGEKKTEVRADPEPPKPKEEEKETRSVKKAEEPAPKSPEKEKKAEEPAPKEEKKEAAKVEEKKKDEPAGNGEGEVQDVEVPVPVKRKPRAKGRKPPSRKLLAD